MKFKNANLSLDELEIQPKQRYIAFVGNTNVVDIEIQKNALKMHIEMGLSDANSHLMRVSVLEEAFDTRPCPHH